MQLKIADALSQASPPIDPSDEDEWDTELQIQAIVASMPMSDTKLDEFRAATAADPDMQTLSKVIRDGWPGDKCQLPAAAHPFWHA